MNYILAITLFLIDLLAANIFNAFILQALLATTIYTIAVKEDADGLGLACVLLSLESFLELGELYFAPAIPLILLQIFPAFKRHFSINWVSAAVMMALYCLAKIGLSFGYGLKMGLLFTSCQLFANLMIVIGIFLIAFLWKDRGRLSSRFYRW